MRITDVSLRQLPFSEGRQQKLRDDVLPGFGVIVGKKTKTFFVQYGKQRHTRTLGRYPALGLKKARQEALKLLSGPEPIKRPVSFSEAREEFLADCTKRLRKSTSDRYLYALKGISTKSLDSIKADVTDPTTLKTLKVFYNWCIDRQYTERNPFLRKKVVFTVRDRLLTDEEIVAIWKYDHPPYSDIVKLLILTGQRRNQIWRYDPSWCRNDVITFPASIMKTNRAHTLPVTDYSTYLPGASFSFNSWSKAKSRMDKHTKVTGYVLHDVRRFFSSTMARLGVPLHVTEQILDHRSQVSGVAATYNRYNYLIEMREALTVYEQHLRGVVNVR